MWGSRDEVELLGAGCGLRDQGACLESGEKVLVQKGRSVERCQLDEAGWNYSTHLAALLLRFRGERVAKFSRRLQ